MKGAKNMSEIQNAIEVKNLKKGFGGRVLFENFSLNVKANTIHAIIGPNGSGKTTLLRLITGVYQPNAGTINIAGKYAMQLENDYLYEEQTGLENLRIFGKYFGFEINDRSDSYCTQLGLTEHLGKRVSTYSKGMKRKLSLLIVIMIGRDILLMDEPTSGVDPISRVEIRSLIEALKADGKTVIITSHDLSEIEKCADDVSMIKNGRLLFDKGIQEMFRIRNLSIAPSKGSLQIIMQLRKSLQRSNTVKLFCYLISRLITCGTLFAQGFAKTKQT